MPSLLLLKVVCGWDPRQHPSARARLMEGLCHPGCSTAWPPLLPLRSQVRGLVPGKGDGDAGLPCCRPTQRPSQDWHRLELGSVQGHGGQAGARKGWCVFPGTDLVREAGEPGPPLLPEPAAPWCAMGGFLVSNDSLHGGRAESGQAGRAGRGRPRLLWLAPVLRPRLSLQALLPATWDRLCSE